MVEDQIIDGLFYDESFARKIVPHIDLSYFKDSYEQVVIRHYLDYFHKYNKAPSKESIVIEISSDQRVPEDQIEEYGERVLACKPLEVDADWLVDKAEALFQERAVYNAIHQSIRIIDGEDKTSSGAIPSILQKALSVSFETHVGHDYLDDATFRFEKLREKLDRIPFKLNYFNKVTNGGLPPKTLSVVMAETGGGKSIFLCDYAANAIREGKNVVYFTMEMAEERIAERIDANLLNITLEDLRVIDKKSFVTKVGALKEKGYGKLIIKEFPTASAHVGHLRAVLEELKAKKNFKPDVIIVDYLNICISQRVKAIGANSYTIVKSIAEELRGLAVEYNVPMITATQVTRGAFSSSDIDMTDTSESIGLVYTVDFFFALIQTEELVAKNQIIVKLLKNRWNDLNFYRKFTVGLNKSKMQFYDLEESAQDGYMETNKKDDKKQPAANFEDALASFNKGSRKPLLNGAGFNFNSEGE